MGGRGSGSRMSASTSGGGESRFMSKQHNMEDYAVAVGMFDRDYMRTEEGKQALREFMEDEIESGLTESQMRQAIEDVGTRSTFRASEVPKRIQSFTYTGTTVAETYESRMYVTRKGDAIKEVTKYSSGRKSTATIMNNDSRYPTAIRTREQFESTLADLAKAEIRTGSPVIAIDDKKRPKSK